MSVGWPTTWSFFDSLKRQVPQLRHSGLRTTVVQRGLQQSLPDEPTPGRLALPAEDHAPSLRPRDRHNRSRIQFVDSFGDLCGPRSLCVFVGTVVQALQKRSRKGRSGLGRQFQRFLQELHWIWCHELILLRQGAPSLQSNPRLSGRRTTTCGVATRVSCAGPLQPLVGRLTASGARTPYSPSTAHRISVPGTALLCVSRCSE